MKIIRPELPCPIPSNAKKVFKGVLFDVYQWEQKLYDGTTATFEKLKRPDTVVVFPVLDDGRIILTLQEQPDKGLFIGTTGGRVDEGEEILEAAKRELLEESGYEAQEFYLWDTHFPNSKIDWVVYTFIAKGLTNVAEMDLDGGEKILLKPVTFTEFVDIATTDPTFSETQIIPMCYEAKLHPEKMRELQDLFNPHKRA